MKKSAEGIRLLIASWRDALEQTSDLRLSAPTEPGQWTLGQVYAHIIEATDGLAIPQLEKCLSPDRESTTKGKTIPGIAVFALGAIPPIRIRFRPSPDYVPKQPANREAIRVSLDAMETRLLELVDRVEGAPTDRRARHPLLGMLNAAEWLQFAQMHLRHHLRQRRRLERILDAKAN
ncbi:MAG TPA: DinB family protein [Thermoanaerobaculia bacterium]|nr:DinB family protein [Thermoanaerobaculia bacterium]